MENNCEQNETFELNRESPMRYATENTPTDFTPFAKAGASIFNGPNGEQALKTVKTAIFVAGGVCSLGLILHYTPDIICCFIKQTV